MSLLSISARPDSSLMGSGPFSSPRSGPLCYVLASGYIRHEGQYPMLVSAGQWGESYANSENTPSTHSAE